MALAQFRDNVLAAAKGPGSTWAMHQVCTLLQSPSSLCVLCPCITDENSRCSLLCMTGDLHALGVAMERRGGCGNVYVHPSAVALS